MSAEKHTTPPQPRAMTLALAVRNSQEKAGRILQSIIKKQNNNLLEKIVIISKKKLGYTINFNNLADKNGAPLLLSAYETGNVRIIKFLIANGASFSCYNTKGVTALSVAARHSKETTERLIKLTQNNSHQTESKETVELPKVTLADLFKPNEDGTTAIAHCQNMYTSGYLINQGLEPTKADCLRREYSYLIQYLTKKYYACAIDQETNQETKTKFLNNIRRFRENGVVGLNKFAVIGKKTDGITSGNLVVSVSKTSETKNLIKTWLLKENTSKRTGDRFSDSVVLYELVLSTLAAEIFPVKSPKVSADEAHTFSSKSPKIKPAIILNNENKEPKLICHTISRFLDYDGGSVMDLFDYVEQYLNNPNKILLQKFNNSLLEQLLYKLIIGDADIKPENFVVRNNSSGQFDYCYGIDHPWGMRSTTFGQTHHYPSPITPENFNADTLAKLLATNSGTYKKIKLLKHMLGNPSQEQIIATMENIINEIKKGDQKYKEYAAAHNAIARITKEQHERGGALVYQARNLNEKETQEFLLNNLKEYVIRAERFLQQLKEKYPPLEEKEPEIKCQAEIAPAMRETYAAMILAGRYHEIRQGFLVP